VRSCAPAVSGARAMTMSTAVASHLKGKDMFNCEGIGKSGFEWGQI
jgi:hypothetical protein